MRWSWKYAVLKYIAKAAFCIYYKSIHITGQNNIPEDGRIIFAANHQNGLMDALAVLLFNRYQPVFLARADIFKKPVIARILRFLKIMPVYRLRDGMSAMEKNEDTFIKTTAVLSSGGCLGIMPEGNNQAQKRLRALKKGIFRIAFRAEELKNNNLGVKIIPVGLNFSNTSEFRGELVVNYGKPLTVSNYFEVYNRHPSQGINEMKTDLAESLKSLMLHVKDEKNYEIDMLLMDIGAQDLKTRWIKKNIKPYKKFLINRELCKALYDHFEKDPGKADRLRLRCNSFSELARSRNVKTGSIERIGKNQLLFSSILRLFFFPVFLVGSVAHLIPVIAIHNFLKRISDSQFISTYKFVLGILLVPLNYLFIGFLALLYLPFEFALLLIAILPVSGLLGHRFHKFSKDLKDKIHFYHICNNDRDFEKEIIEMKSEIIEELEPVIKNAGASLQ